MSTRLVYIVSHEAFYWAATNDENHVASVTVQREALTDEGEHDGCHWEFSIDWIDLGGKAVPQLAMFDDSWQAFIEPEMVSFFRTLGEWDNQNVTPGKVTMFLDTLGFTDTTERLRP